MNTEENRATLELLAKEAAECTRCRLHEGRTNVVFGEGNPDADLMFIGEGPGQYEDEQGRPFVGRSGELLSSLLQANGLARSDVYIANVVKCRPPGNRDPRQDEIDECKGYLADQIRLVDPAVVITLGNFSTKLLLKTETGISRMRGQAYPWWNRHVVPTFHPAAALRGRSQVVEQMQADIELALSVIADREPEQTELF